MQGPFPSQEKPYPRALNPTPSASLVDLLFHLSLFLYHWLSPYIGSLTSTSMTTWINLEYIMLSEKSQMQKDKYYMISLTCGIGKKKKVKVELIVTEAGGRERY